MIKPLTTTVIGSYPAKLDAGKHLRDYFSGKKVDGGLDLVEHAVKRQVEAGLDIISDGQARGDFIKIFVDGFAGAVMERRPVVLSEVEWTQPITAGDILHAKKIAGDKAKVKGTLTGPFTLAKSSEDRHYKSLRELALAYARALNKEAKALEPHVEFIQIDEPFFSVEFPDYGKEAVELAIKGVKKPVTLHACGDVSEVFEKLAEFPVDTLAHEFAANPKLLDVVRDVDFKQRIGFGCVRSDSEKVESVEEIVKKVEAAVEALGKERVVLNPDCGLRNLPEEVAFKKLCNMVEAGREVAK